MEKMKKIILLHRASLILSVAFVAIGVYLIISGDGDIFFNIFFIICGIGLGYEDWKLFLTKKKS